MSNEVVGFEAKSNEKLVVYVRPGLITYGLETLEDRMKEVRARLNGRKLSKVRRPLYGMMLLSLANKDVMKMVQMMATDVYRDYWVVEMKNHCLLYIEEAEDGLQIFMVSGEDGPGFEDFMSII